MMNTIEFKLLAALDVDRLTKETKQRIDLGTARAADVILGYLKRHSISVELHARTGMLARLWSIVRDGESNYRATNPSPYAAIHEYGGEIAPQNAQALAVPISGGPAVTDRGVPRYTSAREAFEQEGLFLLKAKSGNAILAKKQGKDKIEAWYVLKQHVTIPERNYATNAVNEGTPAAVKEITDALA